MTNENPQIVIPVPESHYDVVGELVKLPIYFVSMLRGNIPEISLWPRSMFKQVHELNPSIIVFDGLFPAGYSQLEGPFFSPGNPFKLHASDKEGDIFLVGGDIVSIKQIERILTVLLPNNDHNFTINVLLKYAEKNMDGLLKPAHASSLFTIGIEDSHINLRNALFVAKALETYTRLEDKRREGPVVAVVGTGHVFNANNNIWENKDVGENILLDVFTNILQTALEINGDSAIQQRQIESLVEDLSVAFGATTVWKLGNRPNQRRLRMRQYKELIPIQVQFQSEIIAALVHRAARKVFEEK